jgi:hypothetical protein
MGKKITLIVKKDEERREISFKTSLFGSMKVLRKVRKYFHEGWKLVDCTGDASQVAFIKKVIGGENPFDQGIAHGMKELTREAGMDPTKLPKKLKKLVPREDAKNLKAEEKK